MAAARQTARHAHDERARQSIQRVMVPVMVPVMVGNPHRRYADKLEVGYAGFGGWHAFMRLCDRLGA